MPKFNLTLTTLLCLLLVNEVKINPTTRPLGEWIEVQSTALARTRGGSRGGSFSRPTPSRSSNPTPSRSAPSSPGSNSSNSPSRRNNPPPTDSTPSRGNTGGRARGGSFQAPPTPAPTPAPTPVPPITSPSRGGTVVVPLPVPPPYYPTPQYSDRPYQDSAGTGLKPSPVVPPTYVPSPTAPATTQPVPAAPPPPQSGYAGTQAAGNNRFLGKLLLFLLIAGGAIAALWWLRSKRAATAVSQLDNEIVTVTKLQVALLASARDIQSHLTDLSLSAELDSPAGLTEFLQESALSLLRHPEYWTHVQTHSETLKSREEAARVFEQLSIQERSKFSAETLSNVGGKIRQKQARPQSEGDPASYLVVTLLLGTEDDHPLFDRLHSAEELRSALQQVAAITPDYLLVFELLWSPQEATDSLSYDDLLTQYSDLVQI
ncbi:DUF1517 domain-containing protein [Laspinema olomoucense]|uniref:DUF1517 domain-containing protein n=1 Tax=Laspinema olomoucense D3b TaxID=2953688 RepID=A0ABT2N243_9CYAN|nr:MULTISPECIES: DUF1517 domain-containing protein [unclassified Laspinema]MCT7974723.1 DUF1517 domain-containing protein [Laspinema sp. D3d]MCT7976753.1 DUF1517 domain-containing protein [Laspinema sp. D3b]